MASPAKHKDPEYVAGGIGRFLERLVAEAKADPPKADAPEDKNKP